ncbi:flagellar basal body-associated FliL family protein [Planococcus maritimus]|uniref:Flagellar protein FliL n=2 Tax=Planococcus maritimus TaxID=192421 RepID=A0A7D7SH94_PLAMR|nr:flagellar basal body-associated FliL family protein [Planococcus maritimus]QMT17665.1 flagellar basal body-associated FliL family protein [Planococcus maritimus]
MMKKVVMVLVIAALLGAGGAFYFLQMDKEVDADAPLTADEMVELSIDTEEITTNLATPASYAVVQFNILLGDKKVKEEMEKRHAEVRAAAIATVAGMEKEQLVGTEGITLLQDEMVTQLESLVGEGKVERVLVTQFKVQ